jgi:hypothetical protein
MKKSILIIILIFSMALYSCASSGGVKQQQGTRIGTVVGAGIVEIHILPVAVGKRVRIFLT